MARSRYVVLEKEGTEEPTADARIVQDGFSFAAFLFGPFWLLWHRLWLAGLAALALSIALLVLDHVEGAGLAASALPLLLGLLIGLEGQNLRIGKLRRSGWREAAAIEARDQAEAERRYFDDGVALAASLETAPDALPWSGDRLIQPRAQPRLGLFGGR